MNVFSTWKCHAANAIYFVIAAVLMSPLVASAQLKVIISGGFSGPYEQLLPEFERTTAIKVTTGSGASQGTGPQTIAAQLARGVPVDVRSEEHTSELQSRLHLVCRLLLEKKKKQNIQTTCAQHTTRRT